MPSGAVTVPASTTIAKRDRSDIFREGWAVANLVQPLRGRPCEAFSQDVLRRRRALQAAVTIAHAAVEEPLGQRDPSRDSVLRDPERYPGRAGPFEVSFPAGPASACFGGGDGGGDPDSSRHAADKDCWRRSELRGKASCIPLASKSPRAFLRSLAPAPFSAMQAFLYAPFVPQFLPGRRGHPERIAPLESGPVGLD